jgi:hypothetical protein
MTRPNQRVQDPDQRPGDVHLLKVRLDLLQRQSVAARLGTKVEQKFDRQSANTPELLDDEQVEDREQGRSLEVQHLRGDGEVAVGRDRGRQGRLDECRTTEPFPLTIWELDEIPGGVERGEPRERTGAGQHLPCRMRRPGPHRLVDRSDIVSRDSERIAVSGPLVVRIRPQRAWSLEKKA